MILLPKPIRARMQIRDRVKVQLCRDSTPWELALNHPESKSLYIVLDQIFLQIWDDIDKL